MAVAFSPDGKSVVSSGFETGIYWWNPQTGEKVKTQGGHGIADHELAFSKDGKRTRLGRRPTAPSASGTAAPARRSRRCRSARSSTRSPSARTASWSPRGSFDGLVPRLGRANGATSRDPAHAAR